MADVKSALGISIAEGVVRQALERLVDQGQVYNTLSDERFAAV